MRNKNSAVNESENMLSEFTKTAQDSELSTARRQLARVIQNRAASDAMVPPPVSAAKSIPTCHGSNA
ncbi:MAG: hypothetical protein EBZ14_07530 [Gammaproteobacteria bacterium]|nr:hypothetical protein [Gammaproteobacteria bacterium]NDG44486.1 hypothetical protein [Gammaproteobacteria bacterium]